MDGHHLADINGSKNTDTRCSTGLTEDTTFVSLKATVLAFVNLVCGTSTTPKGKDSIDIDQIGEKRDGEDWGDIDENWEEEKWGEGDQGRLYPMKGKCKGGPKGGCYICKGDHNQRGCPQREGKGNGDGEGGKGWKGDKGTGKGNFGKRFGQKGKGKGKPQGPCCGCGGAHLQRNCPNARGYQVRSLGEPNAGGWFGCFTTIEPEAGHAEGYDDEGLKLVGKGRQCRLVKEEEPKQGVLNGLK